ncbi:MAG: response regulator transcription factor [Lachnospiraceae bacterium]|nr:response regulator transcription factor [Lachnospiraceae bacterium]
MPRILIVEDDTNLREELAILLENAGYEVIQISDFSDVEKQMMTAKPDLVLLDINLPMENGELILQNYRKSSDTPVIMLTSRTGEMDEVLSMSYGADDYITKPYNPTILLLRISAVLKRGNKSEHICKYHDIDVSISQGKLRGQNQECILTKNEMIIFEMLLEHMGEIVSRDDLMTALWDNDEYLNDNALSVNISRLRNKLADLGITDAIETRKKQGYVLK